MNTNYLTLGCLAGLAALCLVLAVKKVRAAKKVVKNEKIKDMSYYGRAYRT